MSKPRRRRRKEMRLLVERLGTSDQEAHDQSRRQPHPMSGCGCCVQRTGISDATVCCSWLSRISLAYPRMIRFCCTK